MRTPKLVSCLALLGLCWLGCSGSAQPSIVGAASIGTYRGHWVSETWSTQLGAATQEYCFGDDGTFVAEFHAQGGNASDQGTFEATDGELILTGTNGTFRHRAEWIDSDHFRLEDSKVSLKYKRVAEPCTGPAGPAR